MEGPQELDRDELTAGRVAHAPALYSTIEEDTIHVMQIGINRATFLVIQFLNVPRRENDRSVHSSVYQQFIEGHELMASQCTPHRSKYIAQLQFLEN